VRGGKLYINGQQQVEPFTAEDAAYEFGPVIVPPGDVLVLGDNRNHSLDGKLYSMPHYRRWMHCIYHCVYWIESLSHSHQNILFLIISL
jgi:hypothetical protein